MRDLFVVAVGAGAVGAMIGAGVTSMLRPPEATPIAFDTKPIADAVERAIARSTAEIRRAADLRRESAAASLAGRTVVDAPAAVMARAATERETDAAAPAVRRVGDASAAAGVDSPFATSNPAPNYARFVPLDRWSEKPELRRKWLFADEATCLAWFGTPDDVQGDKSGIESWFYNEPLPDTDGDGQSDGSQTATLAFLHGRLVRVDADR